MNWLDLSSAHVASVFKSSDRNAFLKSKAGSSQPRVNVELQQVWGGRPLLPSTFSLWHWGKGAVCPKLSHGLRCPWSFSWHLLQFYFTKRIFSLLLVFIFCMKIFTQIRFLCFSFWHMESPVLCFSAFRAAGTYHFSYFLLILTVDITFG